MPEFILDHGTPDAARAFKALDTFTQGYIEAMFFTDASDPDDGDQGNDTYGATVAELAPETLDTIKAECTEFQHDARVDLDEALDTGRINGYDDASAGRDFWYTRNHQGVGFWDRGLGDIGETMTAHADRYCSVYLYRGDDGLLYLA